MVMVAVKFDEYSSVVCAVTVGSDWRKGRFCSAMSWRSCALLEGPFGLLRRGAGRSVRWSFSFSVCSEP